MGGCSSTSCGSGSYTPPHDLQHATCGRTTAEAAAHDDDMRPAGVQRSVGVV
jgi:hypothetical protein